MTQDPIVESTHVECLPEPRNRGGAELLELELAELVCERLSGRHDVPVDLDHDVMLGLPGVLAEELDGAFAAPTQRVHPGIDDETDRAPHLVHQLTKAAVRIAVQAQFLAEALGVQAPSLDIRGVVAPQPAELRQPGELLRQGDLKVVARNGLVQSQRLHLPPRSGRQVIGVGEEPARASRVGRAGEVVRGGLRLLGVGRHRRDTVRQPRQCAEQPAQLGIYPLGDVAIRREQLLAGREEELRVGADEGRELREAALEPGLVDDRLHLLADARHFRHSQLVDLLGRQLGGCVRAHAVAVPVRAIGQVSGRDRLAAGGDVLAFEEGEQLLERRSHVVADGGGRVIAELAHVRRLEQRRRLREDRQQRMRLVGGHHLVAHLVGNVAQRDLGRRHAARQTAAQQFDVLSNHVRQGLDSRDDVFQLVDAVGGHGREHHGRALLHPTHLAEAQQLGREARPVGGEPRVVREQVKAGGVGVVQRGAVD